MVPRPGGREPDISKDWNFFDEILQSLENRGWKANRAAMKRLTVLLLLPPVLLAVVAGAASLPKEVQALRAGYDAALQVLTRQADEAEAELRTRHLVALRDLELRLQGEGRLRAFYNMCTHRGALVCRERSGQSRAFACSSAKTFTFALIRHEEAARHGRAFAAA